MPQSVLRKSEKGNTLYSIAYEISNRKGEIVECNFEYMHAENASHAKACFFMGNQKAMLLQMKGRLRVVGVAPVIGYNVHDEHGDKLSV